MQPPADLNDPLASIERHLVAVEQMLERQSITIARLQDELTEANRRAEWYHIQFSEIVRILGRDLRELRATMICSVVADGPISTQLIQLLLRQRPEDARELEIPVRGRQCRRGC